MERRDPDALAARRRAMLCSHVLLVLAWRVCLAALILVAAWLLTHPEAIGAFFGRIGTGFAGVGR